MEIVMHYTDARLLQPDREPRPVIRFTETDRH